MLLPNGSIGEQQGKLRTKQAKTSAGQTPDLVAPCVVSGGHDIISWTPKFVHRETPPALLPTTHIASLFT